MATCDPGRSRATVATVRPEVPDTQRAGKCQTVRGTAHFGLRRNDIDVADLTKARFQCDNASGVIAVVVRQ